MANFKKQNTHSFWHSPLALGVLFCIVVIFAYNIVGLVQKERETAKKKALVLEEIDTLRARENALSSDIDKLKTPEGIEDTIREKYQVVKPGEKMVMIVDDNEQIKKYTENAKIDHTFWGYIKNLFTKKRN